MLVGQRECISSERYSGGFLSRTLTVFGDFVSTHADLLEAVQSLACVLIALHNRGLITIHVQKGKKQLV